MLTLGAMCFALFMAMLDNTVVNVALPKIQSDLGSGVSGLQWIVDAYTLVFASFMLTGGTFGDIFGRKRAFLGGLFLFSAGSLICGLAPELGILIAGRGLQGLGAALLMPATLAIITTTFPDPRERAEAIGLWAGVSGLALAAGPVVGGLFVDTLGWQSVFFINVPIGVIALLVAQAVVSESKNPEGRQLDIPGQVLGVITLSSLTYALIEGNAKGWRSPVIIGFLGVAAVSFIAFIEVERHSMSPMLPLHFFRNATFATANVVAFLVSFGMFGVLFFISLFLQNVQGYSAVSAGVRFLPMTAAIVFTAPISGRLASRFGSRGLMAGGMALAGIGLLLLERVTIHSSYTDLWWNFTLIGMGLGLTMTPMTAAIMGAVPPERSGMASATTATSREVGGVFGIALLGAIVTARLKTRLSARLVRAGLPPQLRQQILHGVNHGPGPRPLPGVPGQVLHTIAAAIGSSFVDGMHAALLVAGLAVLAGAVLSYAFIRPPEQPRQETAAGVLQPQANTSA
jgi:EmrB/QacA subfamily drug resistance transporter